MLKQFKKDPRIQKWLKSNPWFLTDRFLLYHVCGIHKELIADNYVEDSYEYLKEIEIRIYKMFPDRMKKYYSKDN
jgi:hypothetical protein